MHDSRQVKDAIFRLFFHRYIPACSAWVIVTADCVQKGIVECGKREQRVGNALTMSFFFSGNVLYELPDDALS